MAKKISKHGKRLVKTADKIMSVLAEEKCSPRDAWRIGEIVRNTIQNSPLKKADYRPELKRTAEIMFESQYRR